MKAYYLRNKIYVERFIISVAAFLVFLLSAVFHPFEKLAAWLLKSSGPAHELIMVFIFFVLAFFIISMRRKKELENEIAEHEKAEEALKESEEKFKSLAEHSPNMIFINNKRRIVYVNRKCEEIIGYTREEYYSPDFNFFTLIAPEYRDLIKGNYSRHMKGEEVPPYEYALIAKDGRRIEAILSTKLINYGGEKAILGTITDITERKQTEEVVHKANERLEVWVNELEQNTREMTLLNEMSDLLQTCLTAEDAYAVITQSVKKLFPDESGALYVLSSSGSLEEPAVVWGKSPPSESVFMPNECWALRRGQAHLVEDTGSGLLCPHLTQPLPTMYMCVPVMARAEAIGIMHLRMFQQEPSRFQKNQEKIESKQRLVMDVARHIALTLVNLKLQDTLRNQAIRDSLTGLYNRRYLEESTTRELNRAARLGAPLGIIMIDIDHFKEFNDTYGHDAGDILLRELGIILQTSIRGEDIASRYGGEEFTVVLPETSLGDTRRRADQLREEVKHLNLQYKRQPLRGITISIGVAVFPEHGSSVETLLRKADEALYHAKAEGRDLVVVGQA